MLKQRRLKSAVCDAEVMVIKAGATTRSPAAAPSWLPTSQKPQAMMHKCVPHRQTLCQPRRFY